MIRAQSIPCIQISKGDVDKGQTWSIREPKYLDGNDLIEYVFLPSSLCKPLNVGSYNKAKGEKEQDASTRTTREV